MLGRVLTNVVTSVSGETPSGVIDGVNTSFTLANTSEPDTFSVFLNGIKLQVTNDYTLSGVDLDLVSPPGVGDLLTCNYQF